MTDKISVALKALREIKELRGKPVSLGDSLRMWSENEDLASPSTVADFISMLSGPNADTAIRSYFHGMVSLWDYLEAPSWAADTRASSAERRQLVLTKLGLSTEDAAAVNEQFPVSPPIDQPIRINGEDRTPGTWYTESRKNRSTFYWRAYERYLRDAKRWDSKNVSVLDVTSSDVISDLCDPALGDSTSTRGLVVGYVQSGKTANFTGVIAKAIDSGYRLIIVLAGMQNTLRNQTQRRLDKELVGCEVLEITGEYLQDNDWAEFNSHGDLPLKLGAFDVDRLTTSVKDFQNPYGDLARLRFQKAEPTLPFNHERNSARHPAKLIVIKKNSRPLANLLDALQKAAKAGTPWKEVASLIIDDESDQASLNTKKPKKDLIERTAINKLIVEIMRTLGRAQYVGYTVSARSSLGPDLTAFA